MGLVSLGGGTEAGEGPQSRSLQRYSSSKGGPWLCRCCQKPARPCPRAAQSGDSPCSCLGTSRKGSACAQGCRGNATAQALACVPCVRAHAAMPLRARAQARAATPACTGDAALAMPRRSHAVGPPPAPSCPPRSPRAAPAPRPIDGVCWGIAGAGAA